MAHGRLPKGWTAALATLVALLGLTGLYACTQLARVGQAAGPSTPGAEPAKPAASATRIVSGQPSPQTTPAGPGFEDPRVPTFEDPRDLPVPGPPFGQSNKDGDLVLRGIPKDATGTVDWVKAFKQNLISPLHSVDPTKKDIKPFPFDIEIPAIGAMPNVIFPHFPHTFWLDCANCHPGIFIMKKGSNPISMVKIVNGQFCGRCHGRVAFPLANCTRCHVKPKG